MSLVSHIHLDGIRIPGRTHSLTPILKVRNRYASGQGILTRRRSTSMSRAIAGGTAGGSICINKDSDVSVLPSHVDGDVFNRQGCSCRW